MKKTTNRERCPKCGTKTNFRIRFTIGVCYHYGGKLIL